MRSLRFFGITALAALALVAATALYDISTSLTTRADTLAIPHVFSPNTLIKASDFNDNFNAVSDVINGLIDDDNIKNNGITGSSKLIASSVTEDRIDFASPPSDGALVFYNGSASKLDYKQAGCFQVEGSSTTHISTAPVFNNVATYHPLIYYQAAGAFRTTATAIECSATNSGCQAEIVHVPMVMSNFAIYRLKGATDTGWGRAMQLDDTVELTIMVDGVASTLGCVVTSASQNGEYCLDTDTINIDYGDALEVRATYSRGPNNVDDTGLETGAAPNNKTEFAYMFCLSPQ